MSLVRRYVHEAGGKIALASLLGHETRFKISLPPLADAAAGGGAKRRHGSDLSLERRQLDQHRSLGDPLRQTERQSLDRSRRAAPSRCAPFSWPRSS